MGKNPLESWTLNDTEPVGVDNAAPAACLASDVRPKFMRPSDFEKKVLSEIASADTERNTLLAQVELADVTKREDTGVGFYSHLSLPKNAPRLSSRRWKIEDMPKAHGAHPQLEAGAGFILWIKDGFMTCLEGYTYGGKWPSDEKKFKLSV